MAAKQSVTLSGLGEEGFDRCAVAILEIQQVISRQLPPNCMDKVQPGSDNGYLTLEFSNRCKVVWVGCVSSKSLGNSLGRPDTGGTWLRW